MSAASITPPLYCGVVGGCGRRGVEVRLQQAGYPRIVPGARPPGGHQNGCTQGTQARRHARTLTPRTEVPVTMGDMVRLVGPALTAACCCWGRPTVEDRFTVTPNMMLLLSLEEAKATTRRRVDKKSACCG